MSIDRFFADPDYLITFYVLLGLFGLQFIYFFGIFSTFTLFGKTKKNATAQNQPVSIIICARNEYYSLEKNLPMVLEQDYPDFEVVVVNDKSDDDTRNLLLDLGHKYPHLTVVKVESNNNFFYGKKFPLALGIKSAKHDTILLTDADCCPADKTWIYHMQQHFANPKTKIVLGYGKYMELKGMLNKLIRFDTLWVAIQYFSFAKIGLPYMGVGRNLAYRKSFFNDKKGFVSHYHIPSGDDDLFVNQNASRKNTRIEFSQESHTISEPMTDFESWAFQKRRHSTTGKYYQFYHLFLLWIYPLSTIGLYVLSVILIILNPDMISRAAIACILFLRIVSYLLITKAGMIKLGEKNFLLLAPLMEIFMWFFNLSAHWHNSVKTEKRWK